MISVFHWCFRQRVHNPGILLCYSQASSGWFDSLCSPLRGTSLRSCPSPLRSGSLLSIATMKILRLPLSVSRAFAFRSASDTTLASSFLLRALAGAKEFAFGVEAVKGAGGQTAGGEKGVDQHPEPHCDHESPRSETPVNRQLLENPTMPLIRILVDGYSLLHAWPELARGSARHSATAREALIANPRRIPGGSGHTHHGVF
jgi:hypothetical protein